MEHLGRVLRGWANYFGRGVSRAIFATIDSHTWERITAWLGKKHRIGWRNSDAGTACPEPGGSPTTGNVSGAQPASGCPVPLPRLPDTNPVDTDSHPLARTPHVESPVR
ncbi:group II intron maturase-specific domain-containing protein [Propionicimonas sp.]|uniref:group II intron maturase-specific domain-containing protein n=1 Tax=Propionicimonas sp. TaxID=1955623 RepID=UPI0039E68F3F